MRAIGRVLRDLHDGLTHLTFGAAALAAAYLTAVMAWEVVARYFLRMPSDWAPDTSAVAFAFVVFLAVPWLTQTGGHAAMTFVVDTVRPAIAIWMLRFNHLVGAATCGLCAWFGAIETYRLVQRGVTMIAVTPIPRWIVVGVIVYGLGSAAIHFLRHFAATFAERPVADGGA